MTLSFWQRRDRAPAFECDVAVVGSGLVGASTAFWLRRRRPAWDVALLDAGLPAAGASGRNAGFLLQGASGCYQADRATHGAERARRLLHFTCKNRDLIAAELDGAAFDLRPTGSLTVAGGTEEDRRLRQSAEQLRADGVTAGYLAPTALNERIGGRGFRGGLRVKSGAVLDPCRLVRHVAARSKATVLEHHAVERIVPPGDDRHTALLETPVRPVRARRVALAVNAHLPKLYPALSRFVRPVRAQMLATAPLPRWLTAPVYSHEGFFYLRQSAGGRVLLGGARHLHRAKEVGYATDPTEALQADLEAYLAEYFPHASGAPVTERWAGTMGFSPDGVPCIGAVPRLPGSYWAAGLTGHGMAYGFHLGRCLAARLTGDAPPAGDLFSTDRFDDTS
jgi:glycine/D-amino acid oxidase-like deaminating enzyme